jgi:sulfide dehydrogenase [flavocytochrome c] flavoprotein chain
LSRDALASRWGVKLVTGEVTAIDAGARQVRLADGTTLGADRLVLAPGLDFDRYPGLESDAAFEANPHAWKAGAQTTTLAAQLRAMRTGGTFVLTVPPVPYRCPPCPYERASLVADWLKRNKPGSKVIVLDANPAIVAERGTFERAFNVTHAGVVTYVPNAKVQSIDAASKTVLTDMGSFKADVLNPIPPQRATKLLADAGLVNFGGGRWAGVNVLSYASTVAGLAGVHVIGDSSGSTQPKSGHIANQEAKVCADAIIRQLRGLPLDTDPMTSSACFSTVTMSTASWLNASFAYDPATQTMQAVAASFGEAASASSDNFEDMIKWFGAIMRDTFA